MGEYLSSEQAAEQIGLNVDYLYTWLQRHPEFKPKRAFGRSYLWTAEEVEAVKAEREKSINA